MAQPWSRSNSTASWDLDPQGQQDEEEVEDSEKSSLASELLCAENWPLFLQVLIIRITDHFRLITDRFHIIPFLMVSNH